MKNKFNLLFILLIITNFYSFGQLSRIFNQVYPIGDNPNINWKSSMVKSETILFEANPIVRYSFFNNIYEKFKNNGNAAFAIYFSYRPQLRMYTDNSLPVKMPSYRILAGFQCLLRDKLFNEDNLFAISLESGHYSNGQSGSAFSTKFPDGSKGSDSVIATINSNTNLSDMLNRTDGEFSTDLTELILNYRFNSHFKNNIANQTVSVKYGFTYYQNNIFGIIPIGGYADNLIDIYGHWRHMFGVEYIKACGKNRIDISENLEYIVGAHPFVNPIRSETTFSYFLHCDIGFFVSYIYGHDNYNSRFVDSGSQVSIGIAWSTFPPFETKAMNIQ